MIVVYRLHAYVCVCVRVTACMSVCGGGITYYLSNACIKSAHMHTHYRAHWLTSHSYSCLNFGRHQSCKVSPCSNIGNR